MAGRWRGGGTSEETTTTIFFNTKRNLPFRRPPPYLPYSYERSYERKHLLEIAYIDNTVPAPSLPARPPPDPPESVFLRPKPSENGRRSPLYVAPACLSPLKIRAAPRRARMRTCSRG